MQAAIFFRASVVAGVAVFLTGSGQAGQRALTIHSLSADIQAELSRVVPRRNLGTKEQKHAVMVKPTQCDDLHGKWQGKCLGDGGESDAEVRISQSGCFIIGFDEDEFDVGIVDGRTRAGSEASVGGETWEWSGDGKILWRFATVFDRLYFQGDPAFGTVRAIQNAHLDGADLTIEFSAQGEVHYKGEVLHIKRFSSCRYSKESGPLPPEVER